MSFSTKTLRFRLDSLDLSDPVQTILPTFLAYTKAYNFVSRIGFRSKERNPSKLHSLTYSKIRSKTQNSGLPAQLTCSAISKALESLKAQDSWSKRIGNMAHKAPYSNLQSIRLDRDRSFTFNPLKKIVIISKLGKGRAKFSVRISQYHLNQMKGWDQRSAELIIKDNQLWLHVVFQKENDTSIKSKRFIGIDRGCNNVLVASNSSKTFNKFFSSKELVKIINRYQRLRSSLQKKGTKSAKRHLHRVSGSEKRFRADLNHIISKELISYLQGGDTIVLEDLTGIRNKSRGKKLNKILGRWNFYQLEQFITYKANAKGICVIKVKPYFTSQTCSKCGFCDSKNRKGNSFDCKSCGFAINADLNASRNICNIGMFGYMPNMRVDVNQPNGNSEGISNASEPAWPASLETNDPGASGQILSDRS